MRAQSLTISRCPLSMRAKLHHIYFVIVIYELSCTCVLNPMFLMTHNNTGWQTSIILYGDRRRRYGIRCTRYIQRCLLGRGCSDPSTPPAMRLTFTMCLPPSQFRLCQPSFLVCVAIQPFELMNEGLRGVQGRMKEITCTVAGCSFPDHRVHQCESKGLHSWFLRGCVGFAAGERE